MTEPRVSLHSVSAELQMVCMISFTLHSHVSLQMHHSILSATTLEQYCLVDSQAILTVNLCKAADELVNRLQKLRPPIFCPHYLSATAPAFGRMPGSLTRMKPSNSTTAGMCSTGCSRSGDSNTCKTKHRIHKTIPGLPMGYTAPIMTPVSEDLSFLSSQYHNVDENDM